MNKELNTWKEVVQAMLDNEQVEFFSELAGKWVDNLYFPNFRSIELLDTPDKRYRIKPKTIMIGYMEAPEPVRDASELKEGEDYFLPNLQRDSLYGVSTWYCGDLDLRLLNRGLIHKTEEGAVLHAKALIKISGGSYDHS